MSENELQTQSQEQSIIISPNSNVSHLSMEQRAILLQRWTEAQAATKIDDSFLGKEMTVTALTVYQRDFIDQETGEIGLATYVSFVADGKPFKTASSGALPFAKAVAMILGYDPETGNLPHPFKMKIVATKADQGFKYNFVFAGLAK